MMWGNTLRCCMLLSSVVLAFPKGSYAATHHVNPRGHHALTLTEAVELAEAGDTIALQDGVYEEHLQSVNAGTEGNPIKIIGGRGAVINADPADGHRAVQIFHSHIHLVGFSVNGLHGSDDSWESYIDKCVWIDGNFGEDEVNPIEGFVMKNMLIYNCGSECVRLKNFVTGSIISNNTIDGCGIWDYEFDQGGKNGEGIYTGTSSKQWELGEDRCNHNYVTGNIIETTGNECVDIKEGSSGNVIEFNECSKQLDENSGCFNSRGDQNTFRFNYASECQGAGVRIGGWEVDGHQYGQSNNVYRNSIVHPEYSAIKIETEGQGLICGNTCTDGECRVTGEDVEIIGATALEDCNAGDLGAALGTEPLLQSVDPTPSPVVDSTTEAPLLGVTETPTPVFGDDDDDDGGDDGDDDEGDDDGDDDEDGDDDGEDDDGDDNGDDDKDDDGDDDDGDDDRDDDEDDDGDDDGDDYNRRLSLRGIEVQDLAQKIDSSF